jgi:hypothetical protein
MQSMRVQDPAQRCDDYEGYHVQAVEEWRFVSSLPAGRNTFDLRDGVGEYVIRLDAFHRVDGFLEHVL